MMYLDKEGRVNKIGLSELQGLMPVIEAITNAAHAIEDKGLPVEEGKITITIHRDKATQLPFEDGDKIIPAITDIIIQDNGIGFNDENLSSFNRCDSTYKKDRGGKGVGRLSWLKAFEYAEIVSVFEEDGKRYQRTFELTMGEDTPPETKPIMPDEKIDIDTDTGTKITLKKLKPEVWEHPKMVKTLDTFAQRIVSNCLLYFLDNSMPAINIHDVVEEKPINTARLFKEFASKPKRQTFNIKEEEFKIDHVMFRAGQGITHTMAYAANGRIVESQKISPKDINGLGTSLETENIPQVYIGYVSGDYLDKHVLDDRTGFSFSKGKEGEPELFVSFDDIKSTAIGSSKAFLEPHTSENLKDNRLRIKRVIDKEYPRYRMLAHYHSDEFDNIPMKITGDKLEEALHKLNKEVGYELDKKAEEAMRKFNEGKELEDSDFFKQFTEYGANTLAEYIAHRGKTLKFLEAAQRKQPSGKYATEKVLHELVFPLGLTSDEITYEDHNLWILDERLAYHTYLASDKKMSAMPVESDSSKEPDIAIFDKPFAVINEEQIPYHNVTIIEFKRPQRNDYKTGGTTEDYKDNPLQQVKRYVLDFNKGKVTDDAGEKIIVTGETRYYCYIIADITDSLLDVAKMDSLTPTPDNLGYFTYNSNMNMYVEIISYRKLLQDATNRNRILLDKLYSPEPMIHSKGYIPKGQADVPRRAGSSPSRRLSPGD